MGDINLKMQQKAQAQVFRLLKGRTPAEFIELPRWQRDEVYECNLSLDDWIVIEEGSDMEEDYPRLARAIHLRQEYAVGGDEAGKQIAREARETFYQSNAFLVRSNWLGEFIFDSLADDKPIRIEGIVWNITVIVDLVNLWAEDDEDLVTDDEGMPYSTPFTTEQTQARKPLPRMPRTAYELRQLFAFKHAETIGIRINGSGPIDCSDSPTQKKIKDIACIVKRLIVRFPTQLHIYRLPKDEPYATFYDICPFWDTASPEARQRVHSSTATFTEVMQTRIEEWTRGTPTAEEAETDLEAQSEGLINCQIHHDEKRVKWLEEDERESV